MAVDFPRRPKKRRVIKIPSMSSGMAAVRVAGVDGEQDGDQVTGGVCNLGTFRRASFAATMSILKDPLGSAQETHLSHLCQ